MLSELIDSVPGFMMPPHQKVEAGFRFRRTPQRAVFTVQSVSAVMPLYSSLLDCHRVCPLGSTCPLFKTTFSSPSPCPIGTGDTLAQAFPPQSTWRCHAHLHLPSPWAVDETTCINPISFPCNISLPSTDCFCYCLPIAPCLSVDAITLAPEHQTVSATWHFHGRITLQPRGDV